MKQQRHLIFGAGLTGGYLAGCFISSGINTTFLARKKTLASMVSGLTVSDYQGNSRNIDNVLEYATTKEDEKAPYDFIWLTVKCTSIENNIEELSNYIDQNTTIICCQNGIGSDLAIRAAFPGNTVLTGIFCFNVARMKSSELEPFRLHRSTQGDLVIEEHEKVKPFFEQIQKDLLPSHLSTNINAEQWAKLQLNLTNPVNALADIPTKQMTEDAGFRKVISMLMREHLKVADAMKLDLPKIAALPGKYIPLVLDLPNWLFKIVAQKMLAIDPEARASMWWDLHSGRSTEIDFINGAVVDAAKKLDIACPANQKIIDLIGRAEQGKDAIGLSSQELLEKLQ